jgi:undecaprenyl-diphosphatase
VTVDAPSPSGPETTRRTRRRLLAAALGCAAGFLLLAILVTSGWSRLVAVDERWSGRAFAFTLAHPTFEDATRFVTNLADGWTVTVLTAVVALVLAARREWLLGWWLVVTVAGSAVLSTVVKVSLERMRPDSAGELTSAHGFSFPSGHTQAATVTYVSVVLVVGWQLLRPSRAARVTSVVAVTLVVGAVGLSRIYLGAHWPSDVLGGWLSGSAWVLTATLVLLSRLAKRHEPSAVTEE